MPTCQLCKHDFRSLRFNTEHIGICLRCVNTLNNSPEPARAAEARLGELLARGMRRNASQDLLSDVASVRVRAERTLSNFEAAYARALPGWINRLLENTDNTTRDFKIMRAYRRGMLRMDGGDPWTYPSDWPEKARRIRRRDGCCQLCGATGTPLDVHHIVYLSNFGTNQQPNLVSLCRACHEEVHERSFDLGEIDAPDSATSVDISHAEQPSAATLEPSLRPPTILSSNLICPGCLSRVTAKIPAAEMRSQRVRCPGCKLIFLAADHPAAEPIRQSNMPSPTAAPLTAPLRNTVGVLPDPTKAWMVGTLRVTRIGVALLLAFVALSFFGTLLNISNGKSMNVWPLEGGWHFAILLLFIFGLLLRVFGWLRGYINKKHTVGYGYPHPSLSTPWSL